MYTRPRRDLVYNPASSRLRLDSATPRLILLGQSEAEGRRLSVHDQTEDRVRRTGSEVVLAPASASGLRPPA